ncbi:MAG TPA: hypothetical protein VHC18_07930 [Amycolatopsis sp.]|nr:hypothetical protein [Amycolatopsis sp.]
MGSDTKEDAPGRYVPGAAHGTLAGWLDGCQCDWCRAADRATQPDTTPPPAQPARPKWHGQP